MSKPYGSVSNYGQRNTGKFGGHGHNPGVKKVENYCKNCGQLLKRVRILDAGSKDKKYKYVNMDGRPHICEEMPESNTSNTPAPSIGHDTTNNIGLISRILNRIKNRFK